MTIIAFKLVKVAQNKCFGPRGYKLLADVVQSIKFVNGVKQNGDNRKPLDFPYTRFGYSSRGNALKYFSVCGNLFKMIFCVFTYTYTS